MDELFPNMRMKSVVERCRCVQSRYSAIYLRLATEMFQLCLSRKSGGLAIVRFKAMEGTIGGVRGGEVLCRFQRVDNDGQARGVSK